MVLDTNIWISGLLLPKSPAGNVLQFWQEAKLHIVTSPPILAELKRVLCYPKISKRITWDAATVNQYISLLTFLTDYWQGDLPVISPIKKDPSDTPILATLIASGADYLLTGDAVLLALRTHYSILDLADFHRLLA